MVAEALAPYTLAPAFAEWEALLARNGYSYVWFDSLNRYYLAEEAAKLADCFADAPTTFPDAIQFRDTKPALADQNARGGPDDRAQVTVGDELHAVTDLGFGAELVV